MIGKKSLLLATDTYSNDGGFAIFSDNQLIESWSGNSDAPLSISLVENFETFLTSAGFKIREITHLSCFEEFGSSTNFRVTQSFLKAIRLASGAELIQTSLLKTLAFQIDCQDDFFVFCESFNSNYFGQYFKKDNASIVQITSQKQYNEIEIKAELKNANKSFTVPRKIFFEKASTAEGNLAEHQGRFAITLA